MTNKIESKMSTKKTLSLDIEPIKYFEGEIFSLKINNINSNLKLLSDDEVNHKYEKGDIRIVTEQARYQINTISTMVSSKSVSLQPSYQRRKRWDNGKKSRLIESIIMNVPIPPVFLYEISYSSFEVMDGLQRLTTISDFYNDMFSLSDLEYWKELEGKKYSNLPELIKKGIDRRYLSAIILLQETAKTKEEAQFLKQVVFERLNSGGEKLTPQETRNALYDGDFNKLCIRLSKNTTFRELWKLKGKSNLNELSSDQMFNNMGDVELVLRFFAYRHLDKISSLNVENFLDEYLNQANAYSKETINKLEHLFINTIELIHGIFKNQAFIIPHKQTKQPVKTIYDPLMQVFSKHIDKSETLLAIDKLDYLIYQNLDIDSVKNLFDGKYNSKNEINNRINFYEKRITEILSNHG